MNRTRTVGIALLLFGVAAPVNAQTPAPNVKLQLIARMQTQFNTTSVDEDPLIAAGLMPNGVAGSTFELRRVRFGAEVLYNDWLYGIVENEFAMAQLKMRNVFIDLRFSPQFAVRMGQYKRPFSLIELTSDFTLPVIERGVRIRALPQALALRDSLAGTPRVLTTFNKNVVTGEQFEMVTQFGLVSYDIGASVHGALGRFVYDIGLFNGQGSDQFDVNDARSPAGRITYTLPLSLPVTIGAAFSHRETRTAVSPTISTASSTAGSIDLDIGEFRRKGVRFLGEVAYGSNIVNDDFFGIQGIGSYFIPISGGVRDVAAKASSSAKRIEAIEIAGRVSYGNPRIDIADDAGMLITPGINIYFSGRNRMMLNWDIWRPTGDRFDTEHALRLQAQIYH